MAEAFTQRHRDLHYKTRDQEGYHGDACERTYLKAMKALQTFHVIEDLLRKCRNPRMRIELRRELVVARCRLDKLKDKYTTQYNEWWAAQGEREEKKQKERKDDDWALMRAVSSLRASTPLVSQEYRASHIALITWLDELIELREKLADR